MYLIHNKKYFFMAAFLALQDGVFDNLLQCFVSLKPSSTFVFHMDQKKVHTVLDSPFNS